MQFHFTYIARFCLLVLGVTFFFSSCLKKIDEADQLNTNIYDREYAGGQWYEINEFYQYSNELGQIRIKVRFSIPEENLPDLKASFFDVGVRLGTNDQFIYGLDAVALGGYSGEVDFEKNDDDIYCLTLGVYVPDDDSVINEFQECVSL